MRETPEDFRLYRSGPRGEAMEIGYAYQLPSAKVWASGTTLVNPDPSFVLPPLKLTLSDE